MLSQAEKRAAQLAVSHYGADQFEVERVVEAVIAAQAHGESLDLLDALAAADLLSSEAAKDLRQSLDTTRVDPASPKNRNGAPPLSPTLYTQNGNGKDSAPAALPQSPDVRKLGPYRLLRKIGEGGMGAVYLAYQEGEDRLVALKVLSSNLAANQTSVDRFYREGRHGGLLNHPNIVRFLEAALDEPAGLHYLVMEYVEGASAEMLLRHHGKLAVGDAVHIILDIGRALEHAHSRNIIHRDIKPANILLTKSGLAKLADLGLAKRTDEVSHLTATRQSFGTPYYMPYEQAINAKGADARSDIFALGATLYHLVAGEVPFTGNNPLEVVDKKNLGVFTPASILNPEVPRALDRILSNMLARDPRERYQTASELIVDLERAALAPAVPSFVDLDQAMQDPLVRQRLTAPAQATAADLRLHHPDRPTVDKGEQGDADIWYLRYRDRQGQWCKAKVTTEQILQRLRDGKISLQVETSRKAQGPFQPLSAIGEFRELIEAIGPRGKTPASPTGPSERTSPRSKAGSPSKSHGWLWAGIGASLGIIVLMVFMLLKILQTG